MTKVSVKTGDTVLVNSGKDSGKQGKVLAVKKEKDNVRVIVEGVNIVTKAKRAKTAQEKSELIKQEAAIDISNVNVVCPTCKKPIRIAHSVVNGKKVRVCPTCAEVLDAKYVKNKKSKKAEAKSAEKNTAAKTAKTEKKSNTTKVIQEEKATKTSVAKKPTTARSSQRGV